MGGDILRNGTLIATAEDVALSHHERYDGHGYPRGLAGKSISEEARIVAIADAFDAMSSNRVYRRACDRDHIRRELAEGRGNQFDPAYVDILVDLWDGGQLDDILRQDDDGDDGHEELSIDLLQQAMSSLAQESADVDRLSTDMRVNLGYEGAMDVAYPEFTKLYEYIDNMGRRFDHPFALVMIALEANPGENPGSETLERAMHHMEQSVRQTIRSVDVITRYGERRFLVILSGTSREVVPTVMDRIFRGYYKMNGSGAFSPTYTVAREQ